MAQGICQNCGRLIYDTEKLDELPDKIECQHCHFVNVIREPKVEVIELEKPKVAKPKPKRYGR